MVIKTLMTFSLWLVFFNVIQSNLRSQELGAKSIPSMSTSEALIDRFERAQEKPINFEFYVNFGHMFLTNELKDNFRTFFEVPLGVSFGYEHFTLNLQYNLVFGNIRDPFEYNDVFFKEKTSYGLMNLSAALGYRFMLTPLFSVAPKVGIISSNMRAMNEEFEENPVNYPMIKSNAPVFILNFDFDTMHEKDRKKSFGDVSSKRRRKYALFTRFQILYSKPNYYRLTEEIGEGSILMISLGFGIHRHFMR